MYDISSCDSDSGTRRVNCPEAFVVVPIEAFDIQRTEAPAIGSPSESSTMPDAVFIRRLPLELASEVVALLRRGRITIDFDDTIS